MAITLRINEVIKRSGNLKNLNLAAVDSKIVIIRENNNIFTRKDATPITKAFQLIFWAIPKGKNKLEPKAIKIISLFAEDHSINANLFPEYSNIIAS